MEGRHEPQVPLPGKFVELSRGNDVEAVKMDRG